MKVGPFTWKKSGHGDDCEVWELVVPKSVHATHFCVKNYGGQPKASTGFSGWRLVSGGPFTDAGGWTSRDEAMRAVVPYLLDFYRAELKMRELEAAQLHSAIKQWLQELEEA